MSQGHLKWNIVERGKREGESQLDLCEATNLDNNFLVLDEHLKAFTNPIW